MDEAQILATTYKDKLTAYRPTSYIDPDTEETRSQGAIVYEDEPCALSQSKNDVSERAGGAYEKAQNYMMFTRSAIRLQENDHVMVITEAGELYEGRSGRSMVYTSHSETPLKVEGIV